MRLTRRERRGEFHRNFTAASWQRHTGRVRSKCAGETDPGVVAHSAQPLSVPNAPMIWWLAVTLWGAFFAGVAYLLRRRRAGPGRAPSSLKDNTGAPGLRDRRS